MAEQRYTISHCFEHGQQPHPSPARLLGEIRQRMHQACRPFLEEGWVVKETHVDFGMFDPGVVMTKVVMSREEPPGADAPSYPEG